MFNLLDAAFRGWFMGAVDDDGKYTLLIVLAFFGLLTYYLSQLM